MDDLISREAAIEYLMTNMGWHDEDGYEVDDADEKRKVITDLVNGIPAVDAVPVVHGQWIRYSEIFHDPEYTLVKCSVCGGESCCDANYCPDCGAKMDGERREATPWTS